MCQSATEQIIASFSYTQMTNDNMDVKSAINFLLSSNDELRIQKLDTLHIYSICK